MKSLTAGLLFLALIPIVTECKPDRSPPEAKWIQPKHRTVIQSNIIRLLIDARDGSGIKSVSFLGSYQLRTGVYVEDTVLAVLTNPPFEFLWDCHDIPDQDMWRLDFKAVVDDSAGNSTVLKKKDPYDRFYMVLDRNPKSSLARHACHFFNGDIIIDGILNEWPDLSTETFKNNDNLIHFKSCWNRNNLFLSAIVTDYYLAVPDNKETYKQMRNQKQVYLKLFLYDYVEFSFDPRNLRGFHKTRNQPELQICPDGTFQGNFIDLENSDQLEWGSTVKVSVKAHGTLNNHEDLDSFYVIEAAIPWNELGIVPVKNLEMGFDFFNGDMEVMEARHKSAFTSWSGVLTCNNDNPTEWGTLVLKRESGYTWLFWALGSLLLIIVILKLYLDKKRLGIEMIKISNPKITASVDHLKQNYQDQDLTIGKLAAFSGLNETYFGTLFRKQTGKSYNHYLNELRIEKAVDIMKKEPTKQMTDVAFEVGFGTLDHFIRIFKKIHGLTPKQYIHKLS